MYFNGINGLSGGSAPYTNSYSGLGNYGSYGLSGLTGSSQNLLGSCNGVGNYSGFLGSALYGQGNLSNSMMGNTLGGVLGSFNYGSFGSALQGLPMGMITGSNTGGYSWLPPNCYGSLGSSSGLSSLFGLPGLGTSGTTGTTGGTSSTGSASGVTGLSQSSDGTLKYETSGGWKVSSKGDNLTLTSPDGKTTKVTGKKITDSKGKTTALKGETDTLKLSDGTTITLGRDTDKNKLKTTTIIDNKNEIKIKNTDNSFTTQAAETGLSMGTMYVTSDKGVTWKKQS